MGLIFVDWSSCDQPESYDKLMFEVNKEGEKISILFSGEHTTVFDLGDCNIPASLSPFDTTYYDNKAELMAELDIEEENEIEDALDWQDQLIGCGVGVEDDDEFQRNLDALLLGD